MTTAEAIDRARGNPGAIVLVKMGDSFEAFHDDAKTIARELGLSLTTRCNRVTGEVAPMAGFPHHQGWIYTEKLRANGHAVAPIDHRGTPIEL